jgi:molybdopterin/thiamine biosynthesis adenylyltransferase/rhodanese-related sulfurtransferase
MQNMEPLERKRYSRQIIMPEIGVTGQEKLKAARVLVIGAGGLGCPVLQYLVAAGVGTLGVVDDDVVDLTNLHRQILYGPDDIGKGKAVTATAKLSVFNPFTRLIALPVRLTKKNASDLISNYDLVIDGSDNFPTRYLVSDACAALGKTMVFGSILRFEGQVSVFNYQGGPTYRDLFSDAEEGDNCEVAGVLGVLPGIIGSYMANETIKIICGVGEILSGKLMVVNALSNSHHIFTFSKPASRSNSVNVPQCPTDMIIPNGEIPADALEKLLESDPDSLHLVDVREEYEFEEDYIGGVNIPLPDLPANLTEIPADKTIVFYCISGKRSKLAYDILSRSGFEGKAYWAKKY